MEFLLPLLVSVLSLCMPWQFHLAQITALVIAIFAANPQARLFPSWFPFDHGKVDPGMRMMYLGSNILPLITALPGMVFLRSSLVPGFQIWQIPAAMLEFSLVSFHLIHSRGLLFFINGGPSGAFLTGKTGINDGNRQPWFLKFMALAHFADLYRLVPAPTGSTSRRWPGLRSLMDLWMGETSSALRKLGYSGSGEWMSGWTRFVKVLPESLLATWTFLLLPLSGFVLFFLP